MRLRISLPVHAIVSSRRSAMMRGAIEDGVSWHMVAGVKKHPPLLDAAGPRSPACSTHLWVRFQQLGPEDKRREGSPGVEVTWVMLWVASLLAEAGGADFLERR